MESWQRLAHWGNWEAVGSPFRLQLEQQAPTAEVAAVASLP
jgi:hypothetical protein